MGKKEKAISLTEDATSVSQDENIRHNECFGGVVCRHCEIATATFIINEKKSLDGHQMWCKHADRSIVDIFYDEFAKCPLDYWVKAAMPSPHLI
jgi:hypothetical protein